MIRVWHSYSCNNSSAYRLLARFVDAASAKAVAAELAEFFTLHGIEIDGRAADTEEESETQRALAAKYGFAWSGLLYWGAGRLSRETPDVFTEGEYLVVHHDYCGGFGGLGGYLRARGGTVDPEERADVDVTLMFRMPDPDPVLDAQLEAMFEQAGEAAPFKPAWESEYDAYGTVAWFRDAGTVGLYAPVEPRDLPAVRAWLEGHGYGYPVIRLGEREDVRLFAAIAKARCRSCGGPLEYLDPGLHDIETPQLVCRPCGGFYEPFAFLEAT